MQMSEGMKTHKVNNYITKWVLEYVYCYEV